MKCTLYKEPREAADCVIIGSAIAGTRHQTGNYILCYLSHCLCISCGGNISKILFRKIYKLRFPRCWMGTDSCIQKVNLLETMTVFFMSARGAYKSWNILCLDNEKVTLKVINDAADNAQSLCCRWLACLLVKASGQTIRANCKNVQGSQVPMVPLQQLPNFFFTTLTLCPLPLTLSFLLSFFQAHILSA